MLFIPGNTSKQVEKTLKFSQFGSDNGRIVIYFHGVPGAPEEGRIFDRDGKAHDLRFICFDRFAINSSLNGESYYKRLAEEISKISKGNPVDFIGFSIGAFIALQTYCHMANHVKCLHLVSAAAPLETGDYLETMAGKQVFQLAKAFPTVFLLLSYGQSLLAWIYPKALFRMLFASAAGEDKTLADDSQFQSSLIKILRICFMNHVRGYARDIGGYVQPWKSTLTDISVDTHIWHGAEDNWSPTLMASYLKSSIPGWTSTKVFSGLSHYSCLYRAAPEICNLLSKA
jgi:pimeloyl-ACP methyl ester carboxylesterase